MNVRVAVFALVVAVAMAEANFVTMFEQYKTKYGRKYASAAEEAKKFRTFVANMKKASKLHATNPKATFGVNEFADMSAEEFKIRHSGEEAFKKMVAERKEPTMVLSKERVRSMPQEIDWRQKGAVTPIKNQGQCGSCWSFSTTGSIEGQWFLAGNPLTSVSEQELVSCDDTDFGCGGGWPTHAMEWLISNRSGHIVTEASYPYVSGDGMAPACSLSNSMKVGATISAFVSLPSEESQMAAFVGSNGPLSICVDATSWQTYTGGILTNCISDQIDHAVLIVGYDMTNSPPYWIIKNSWGTSWGENGYIRVEYGTNQCLLTEYPASANVTGNGPTPSGATWTQLECKDFQCKQCESTVLSQGACNTGNGFWFSGVCADDGVIISYYTSAGCTGTPAQVTVDPINQCSISVDFFGTRFIENLCHAAPTSSPVTPSPYTPQPYTPQPYTPSPYTPEPYTPQPYTPSPMTPAPTSPGNFTQMTCQDVNCTVGCNSAQYPQNLCVPSTSSSTIGLCISNGLFQLSQYTSPNCTGPADVVELSVDTCYEGQSNYFSVSCP